MRALEVKRNCRTLANVPALSNLKKWQHNRVLRGSSQRVCIGDSCGSIMSRKCASRCRGIRLRKPSNKSRRLFGCHSSFHSLICSTMWSLMASGDSKVGLLGKCTWYALSLFSIGTSIAEVHISHHDMWQGKCSTLQLKAKPMGVVMFILPKVLLVQVKVSIHNGVLALERMEERLAGVPSAQSAGT